MPTSPFGGTSLGGGSRATATAHGCALTTAPPIGCLLCFHACWPGGTITPSTLVDNTGAHTWTFGSVADTGNLMRCMLGWTFITAIPTTVTLTLSATSSVAWTSSRYGGDHGGNPRILSVVSHSAQTGAGVTAVNANCTAVTPQANRLYVQTVGNNLPGVGITPVANWQELDDQGTATANCRVDSAYRILDTSAVVAYGGSGSAASWSAVVYGFDTRVAVEKPIGSVQIYRSLPVSLRARY